MLYVNFPKYVKEITIRSDYESLELFAEIGGYVGLFMGVSIVQIKSILKFFIIKITHMGVQTWKLTLFCK